MAADTINNRNDGGRLDNGRLELENERVLVRREGLGTFVAEPKVSGRLFQLLTGSFASSE